MDTTLRTVKTAMRHDKRLYMLGCFCPIDDVELGITKFRARRLAPELVPLPHVSTGWYESAFEQLPHAMLIADATTGKMQLQNTLSRTEADNKATDMLIELCLDKGKASITGSLEFGDIQGATLFSGQSCRVWAWPLDNGSIAISWRPVWNLDFEELGRLWSSANIQPEEQVEDDLGEITYIDETNERKS